MYRASSFPARFVCFTILSPRCENLNTDLVTCERTFDQTGYPRLCLFKHTTQEETKGQIHSGTVWGGNRRCCMEYCLVLVEVMHWWEG